MKINFITFANTESNFSTERISFEARNMNLFSDIKVYTENDFDEQFLKTNGSFFKEYKRGYGYWSWKPYIIKKELETLTDGDIVVYADCGCMFIYNNRLELKKWIDIATNSESGILSPCYGPYVENNFTRMDLYDYINKTYNKHNIDIFDNAIQCGAGILIISKKPKSVDFVNQWHDVMTNHFHLCTDEKSSIPNHPNFIENRHDQSVFSMLSKIYDIETINSENGILNKKTSPIIAARIKNDKYTWKKPIEVLFDGQIYSLQKFGGISRLYIDIANGLNNSEIINNYTGIGLTKGNYQDFVGKFAISKTNNKYLSELIESGDTSFSQDTIEQLSKGNFDIFYPTFYNTYFLDYIGDKPFVMSVHDMIPEIYTSMFPPNGLQIIGKRKMVQKASAIEVNTECTKKDLIRLLNVDEKKIHVISRALNPTFGTSYYNNNPFDYDYILYVGTRWGYKRFDWFLKHISPFLRKHKNIHLVCTGSEFNEYEIKWLKQNKIFKRSHTIFADETMLATLYKYAKFFVFSSEYEGFGMPILESYKMECIALLNENECFKEVTFNKGTFFNLSENESNLSEVAERILSLNSVERKQIIDTQNEILSHYSYDKFMNNVKNFLKSAVTNKYVDNQKNTKPNDLDIFICTHTDFKPPLTNNIYKIVDSRLINNDSWGDLKGSFYSEIMSYFYVAERVKLKKYVGFCHYRRYFNFMDDIPNIDELIGKYEIIAPKILTFDTTIKEQYKNAHNIEDLYIVSGIIAELYPDYINGWNKLLNGKSMFPYNMFIMKSDEFLEYVKFQQRILYTYISIVGIDIENRINNNKDKYLKDFSPNNEISYQYRIGGYIAERLTSLWIMHNHNQALMLDVTITEDKYN